MLSSNAMTLVKMLENLPDTEQKQVLEHVRAYIAELQDDSAWESSFAKTETNLVAAARRAKEEIKSGKAEPFDLNRL